MGKPSNSQGHAIQDEREDEVAELVSSGQLVTIKTVERDGAFPCWPSADVNHPESSNWKFLCPRFNFGRIRQKLSQTQSEDSIALDMAKKKWGLSNFPRKTKGEEGAFDFSPVGYQQFQDCDSSMTDDETLSETSSFSDQVPSTMSISSASNAHSVCYSLPVLEEGEEGEGEDEGEATTSDITSKTSEGKEMKNGSLYDLKKKALSVNHVKTEPAVLSATKTTDQNMVPREDYDRIQGELQARLKVIVALKNVVVNQRKSMTVMEKKNEMYKRNLTSCQKALSTLQERHLDHKSRLATLEIEREVFEAAAMWSKEEVKTVRSEMENLSNLKIAYEDRIRKLTVELEQTKKKQQELMEELQRVQKTIFSSGTSEFVSKDENVEDNSCTWKTPRNQEDSSSEEGSIDQYQACSQKLVPLNHSLQKKEKELKELKIEVTMLRRQSSSTTELNQDVFRKKIGTEFDEELKNIIVKRRTETLTCNKSSSEYAEKADFSLEKLMGVRVGRQSLDVHGYDSNIFESREDTQDLNRSEAKDERRVIVRADSYPSPSHKSFSSSSEPIIYCDEESSSHQSSLTCSISTRRSF